MTYQRILLKISGEALSGEIHPGETSFGIDKKACAQVVSAIKSIHHLGVQVGVVVGGGNFFRGSLANTLGLSRVSADHMGMLATVMNGIFLSEALQGDSIPSCVMGSRDYGGSVELFSAHSAQECLKQNKVVVCVGGTGNPYFTTDTAAALRACEIGAEMLFKATKVAGIYNKDPIKYADAKKYDTLSYSQALIEDLKVMDAAAIALCRDSKIPIFVFDLFAKDAFLNAVCHLQGGTKVS